MTVAGVADTHAALWYLFGDARLSFAAKEFVDKAAASRRTIAISPISVAEVLYLVEKKRLPEGSIESLTKALRDPDHVFVEAPLNSQVVESMRHVPRGSVSDMPDRIVAGTALYLGVPVISRDNRIRASAVQTIW